MRRRQCKSKFRRAVAGGSASVTDFCTRERGHEGPHASAWAQVAWVDLAVSKQVSYRWPFDHLRDDTTLTVNGVKPPEIVPLDQRSNA